MRGAEKIVRWFALLIAAVLSSLSISTTLAENPVFQQVLPLYTAPATNNPAAVNLIHTEQEQRLNQLQAGAYGKPEDFTAKAHLFFKTEMRPTVSSIRPFVFQAPTVGSLENGWRGEESLYFWRGGLGIRALPLTIPLAPKNSAKPFQLMDFKEFQIDYSSVGVPLCEPEIKFQASILSYTENSKKLQDISVKSNQYLGSFKTIDTTLAEWKERESSYLVRRVLGLAYDEDWRYVQSKGNGVMQRRLHEKIDQVNVLDIVVAPNTLVERINLLLTREDNYSKGELVEFVFPQNITMSDGRQAIRLDMGEVLKKNSAKNWAENSRESSKPNLYLQEIFIYIPGEARAISKKRPVKKLIFRGEVNSGGGLSTFRSNIAGANQHRMIVDLRRLTEKGQVNLKSTELLLRPPEGAASCAIRIERMEIVSTYSGNIPVFAKNVDSWSHRWGGSLGRTRFSGETFSQYDQVGNPGIVGYFPFSTLAQDERQDSTAEVEMRRGTDNQLQFQPVPVQGQLQPYRIVGLNGKEIVPDKMSLVSSVGAVLRAEGAMPRVTTENDLLVLEGQSKALEISWPLAAHINDKTWFYLGVGEGIEQTGIITLTLGLSDGSVVQRQVVANEPLHLVTGEAEVQNVRLRILPAVFPYHFKLQEMVFFAPTAASYAQAFTLPLPTQYNVAPKPVFQSPHTSVLKVGPGHVVGLASSEPFHFSTPINPTLDWVRGVQLNYRLPRTYSNVERCPLHLQFNWVKGKTERQVCLEKPDGVLFIPMAGRLGATGKPKDLGALQSIDWVFRSSTSGGKGVPELFDLQFSVNGWGMISAADYVRLLPIFNVDRYPIFSDVEHSKEIDTGLSYLRGIWLPLEDSILAAGGQIQPVENWLFTLNQVVVEPRKPMSWDRWRELTETPTSKTLPRWPKWLAWFSALLLILVAWKKGYWTSGKAWVLKTESFKVLNRLFHWVLGKVGWWVWLVLVLALYGGGLLGNVGSWENYIFTLGALAMTLLLRAGLLVLKPLFSRFFPVAVERVYGGAGNLYFCGALAMLVATATVLSAKLEFIAEQLVLVAYYCLVIGTVQAIWALRKGNKKTVEIPNSE